MPTHSLPPGKDGRPPGVPAFLPDAKREILLTPGTIQDFHENGLVRRYYPYKEDMDKVNRHPHKDARPITQPGDPD